MSGKRLLDAIQFLNVSKTVAAKHLAIRQHQLDVYTRTSSLTKGIKAQTEGLILTAKAAAALARRFDEPSPPPPSAADFRDKSTSADKPAASAATSPPPDQARKLQREAESQIPASAATYSASEKPNGLNVSPQQEVFYEPSLQSGPDLSGLPRVKLPKVAGDTQVGSDGLNADVFHSSIGAEKPAAVEQEMSEEMIQGLFHSPRVSRMISGKPPPKREWKLAARPQQPVVDHVKPVVPEVPKSEAKEMEELAAIVAEDVVPNADIVSEVKREQAYQMLESRVPSSRLGRLWQYGGLATSMAFGAVGEGFRRATGSQDSGSIMFSAGNMERMVAKLSKMRGAALKLGQMLSIQGALFVQANGITTSS
jgi:aarF domain-containing kinase